jgi:hypothetical protein
MTHTPPWPVVRWTPQVVADAKPDPFNLLRDSMNLSLRARTWLPGDFDVRTLHRQRGWALRRYRGEHRQDGYRLRVTDLGAVVYCSCKHSAPYGLNCQRCGRPAPSDASLNAQCAEALRQHAIRTGGLMVGDTVPFAGRTVRVVGYANGKLQFRIDTP